MNYIEQEIKVLFKQHINYQKIDFNNNTEKKLYYKNRDEFLKEVFLNNNISIITGCNGIGKTAFLEYIYTKLQVSNNVTYIKLKNINNINELKKLVLSSKDFIIFDGLDELNSNITLETCSYLLSIDNKKILVSSRKDFLQKSNLLNEKYNIYEIMPLADYRVQDILKQNSIEKKYVTDIFSLIKVPRFLEYILDIKSDLHTFNSINKYELLELIVDKHLDVLNTRANISIEKHIHKKILQTMALVMMMLGKMNLTLEEFTVFLSKIDCLDIKMYILNNNIFESFLNNQLLLNDGLNISFECKEIMEFLTAKEILENKLSNNALYSLVIDEKTSTINPLWFNTISYVITNSKIYRKLILDYIYNNLSNQDNILDLLLNIKFSKDDISYVETIVEKVIFQYTKLYQYIDMHNKSNNIFEILSVDYNVCLNKLITILSSIKLTDTLDDFNIIYINNILSSIEYIVETYKPNKEIIQKLKLYFKANESYYINCINFNVRYLIIYLQIFSISKIDNILSSYAISDRLLSLILHYCPKQNKLKNLDPIINNYILQSRKRFNNNNIFIIDNSSIKDFILKNYNSDRIINLLHSITSDKHIAGFINFINSINYDDFFALLDDKIIVEILYNKVLKTFLKCDSNKNSSLKEEILFDYRRGSAFENILRLCIKYNVISIDTIANCSEHDNYVIQFTNELIIKILLQNNTDFKLLFSNIEYKDLLFRVWKLDLSEEEQKAYELQIKKYFNEDYKAYISQKIKLSNRSYVEVEQKLNKIENSNNIFYKIETLYGIIKNETYKDILLADRINNNRVQIIITKILNYINNLDILKLNIQYHSLENSYTLSYDFIYYPKAMYILSALGYDISLYNKKNIILLNNSIEQISVPYTHEDYKYYINYLQKNASNDYIKHYLYHIINQLKNTYPNDLSKLLFKWIDLIDFNEYETNNILSFLYEHQEYVTDKKIKQIKKFKDNKICQDLLISLNYENAIIQRINYIKENLVFEGDLMDIETHGNFEYSSGNYTKSLSNISINYNNYIIDILEFAFDKYNSGNYYYFLKYILDMVTNYIKNNIDYPEINIIIERILELEKKSTNRYFYNICNSIKNLKSTKIENIYTAINKLNYLIHNYNKKIFSYDELFNIIKEILETNILDDIKRMSFFEIFKDKNKNILPLKEETYQFLIGYELKRVLSQKGFNAEVIFEATGYDKKRSDILIVCEGFIQNIVIETKLIGNSDLGANNIQNYITNTLNKYCLEFNSPKLLFALINQTSGANACKNTMKRIDSINNDKIYSILIDLKDYFYKNRST